MECLGDVKVLGFISQKVRGDSRMVDFGLKGRYATYYYTLYPNSNWRYQTTVIGKREYR